MTEVRRRSQEERRRASRDALLEAGARDLSHYGYHALNLERVAREAGYSRGALYHQFPHKDALVLAVIEWVQESWYREVFDAVSGDMDPAMALRTIARQHAVFCRRDIARVAMTLRIEFATRDHPVGSAVHAAVDRVVADCEALVSMGRSSGSIPPGPPSDVLAAAIVSSVEGLVIGAHGQEPYDEQLAEAVVVGLLSGVPGSGTD